MRVFKDSFDVYRNQQLKQTKRGMLPRMRPLADALPDDAPDVSDAGTPGGGGGSSAGGGSSKPKAKIEILPGGRKRQ